MPCTAAPGKLHRLLSSRTVLHGSSHFAAKTDVNHLPSRNTDLGLNIAQQCLKRSDAAENACVPGHAHTASFTTCLGSYVPSKLQAP